MRREDWVISKTTPPHASILTPLPHFLPLCFGDGFGVCGREGSLVLNLYPGTVTLQDFLG